MQTKLTPAEGKSSDLTTDKSASRGAACCASLGDNSGCFSELLIFEGQRAEKNAEKESKDPEKESPCPHCGSLKDPWFSRVLPMSYHCQDCGKDVDATLDNSLHNDQLSDRHE